MRRLFFRSTIVALIIPLPMFGCISDNEPDNAKVKNVTTNFEHASRVDDFGQEHPLHAQTFRVWETAAGELVFNSGETFIAMTTQRQGLIDNKRLEGKAATTDKDKEIDLK